MKKYKWLIFFVSIIAAFSIILDQSLTTYERFLVALIPFFYGLCVVFLLPKKLVLGAGFCMMMIVSFLRYVVYPILFSYERIENDLMQYFDSAVGLTLFEMFVVFILFNRFYDYKKWKIKNETLRMDKVNPVVPMALLVYSLFVYIAFPMVFANKHFILNAEEINIGNEIMEHNIPGFISMPVGWGNVLIVLFFFYYFYSRYIKYKNKKYFYISILVIMYPCLFYSGHSRLSLLMPLVGCMFMLVKVYREKSKQIIKIIAFYGIVAILALSWFKFNTDSVSEAEFEMADNASSINAYFGGLKNMMIGIRAYENYGSSLSVFVNDMLRNAMGISSFFENNPNNSVTIFNSSAYLGYSFTGYDQICPTIIEGALCFSIFLCFIPTIIMIKAISWMDKQWYKASSLEFAYLFATTATLEGWCLPGNLMHLSTAIFNSLIPISLLIILNRKLYKSR